MIDEEVLASLVREAVEEVEVPDDGPRRVLAARDRLARSHRGVPVARWRAGTGSDRRGPAQPRRLLTLGLAVAALVVAAIVAVGTLGSTGKSPSSVALHQSPTIPGRPGASPTAAGAAGSSSGKVASGTSRGAGASLGPDVAGGGVATMPPALSPAATAPAAPNAPGGTPVADVPTKVIKTGTIGLRVARGDLDTAMARLGALATGLGGYVESSKSTETGTSPNGQITLQVPEAQFATLVTQVQAVGHPVSVSTSGQDVTSQYAGLSAQIQSLQASRSQLLQVLTKAESVSDILAVEQQITPLDSQIQQLQAQLKVLDGQTSYGTLSVSVTAAAPRHKAKVVPPAPSGLSRAWQHARHGFTHGLESVVSASGGIAVFLVCALVVILALRLAWRLTQRRLV